MTYRIKLNHACARLARCAVPFACALVTAAWAAPLDLPPVAEPANGEHHYGKMIWADLVSPDIEGAKHFYSALFGWTFQDLAVPASAQVGANTTKYSLALLDGVPVAGVLQRSVTGGGHAQAAWLTFLAVRDADEAGRTASAQGAKILAEPRSYGRASVNAMPDDLASRHPHWLNFIRVQNATDAAVKVASLGGSVLVEAHTDRHGGQVAIVADPQGAPFGLMEWTDTAEQGSAK